MSSEATLFEPLSVKTDVLRPPADIPEKFTEPETPKDPIIESVWDGAVVPMPSDVPVSYRSELAIVLASDTLVK